MIIGIITNRLAALIVLQCRKSLMRQKLNELTSNYISMAALQVFSFSKKAAEIGLFNNWFSIYSTLRFSTHHRSTSKMTNQILIIGKKQKLNEWMRKRSGRKFERKQAEKLFIQFS